MFVGSRHSSVYVFMSDTLNVTPECIALGVHSKAIARIFVWGIALPFLPSPPLLTRSLPLLSLSLPLSMGPSPITS